MCQQCIDLGCANYGARFRAASRRPAPRAHACLGLDCHEFSSAPSHAQACKRLVVAAVARALCAPHRQPLPSSTRRSTLLVCGDRRTVAAPRRDGTAPGRHGHQTTPCRKPWRARVCRSTSRPAHPITELPPILSLNLDMSACLWRARKGMRSGPAPSSLPRGAVADVAAAPAPPGVCATGRGVAAPLSRLKVARRGSKSALVGFRHAESLSPPRY